MLAYSFQLFSYDQVEDNIDKMLMMPTLVKPVVYLDLKDKCQHPQKLKFPSKVESVSTNPLKYLHNYKFSTIKIKFLLLININIGYMAIQILKKN